jgi:hypothetical protein
MAEVMPALTSQSSSQIFALIWREAAIVAAAAWRSSTLVGGGAEGQAGQVDVGTGDLVARLARGIGTISTSEPASRVRGRCPAKCACSYALRSTT